MIIMNESLIVMSFGLTYVLTGVALLGISLKMLEPKQKLAPVRQRRK